MTAKKKKDIGYIAILVLCVIAGAISWNLYFKVYTHSDTVDIHAFPMQIGAWSAKEMPISKADLEILETDNAFVREFTNDNGEQVYLYVVYSESNRKVSHPPEICYTGAGMEIVNNEPASLSSKDYTKGDVRMNRLTVEKGSNKQYVYYWFKVGDTFTSNYWKQQALIALKTFLGQPASSAMIRISADISKGEREEAEQSAKTFGTLAVPYLQKYLP